MTSSSIRLLTEIVVAGLSILAFTATIIWPDWFELLFGADPDGGDGTLERVIALSVTGATATTMILLAGRNLLASRRLGEATS